MTGLFARWMALALFVLHVVLAFIFHAYWEGSGRAGTAASLILLRSSVMMGGMLMVVAFGAGDYSVDAMMRRQKT